MTHTDHISITEAQDMRAALRRQIHEAVIHFARATELLVYVSAYANDELNYETTDYTVDIDVRLPERGKG